VAPRGLGDRAAAGLGQVIGSIRHLRPHQALILLASRALRRFLDVDLYYAMWLAPDTALETARPLPELELGLVDVGRLQLAAADAGSGLSWAYVEAALQRREECYGAFLSGVLVSYAWFSPGRAHLVADLFVTFDPACAYSRWAFTRPEHRGRGLYQAVKRHALAAYVRRGRRGILSLVKAVNFESLNSAAAVGCRRRGLLVTTRLAGRVGIWASAGCRAFGLGLERG
jgi:GNAT superfamily N-acetyltransferase